MEESFLQDLQVLLALLVLLVRMGLRAFLDRLGRKANQVQRGLQALTASLVQKGLLEPLAFLEYRARRAYLFHPFQVHQDPPVQEATVLQEALDLLVLLDLLDSAQQELLDQPVPASMDQQDLSGLLARSDSSALQVLLLEMLDLLEQSVPLVLPDLLAKGLSDLSALSALSALPAQQEISALSGLLVRPDQQGLMDIV